MILEKRGESIAWLSKFYPPTAMHYAGHINLGLSTTDQKRLKLSVADKIQQNDIGFGYGALAAGSDILIAEALLAEGGELHVILPSNQKEFLEHSVKPFGAQWVKRFKTCLISYVLKSSDETHSEYFESATDAFNAAKGLRAGKSELRLGLHVDIDGADSESELNSILEYGPPQSTLMSELFASILAYQTPENFNMNFAGLIRKDEQSYIRCYAANS